MSVKAPVQLKSQYRNKLLPNKSWLWIAILLAIVTLACGTNTPLAQRATARPTRTPLPTFTPTPVPTPVPAVPTQSNPPTEPLVIADAPEPTPTDTPVPPTDTPVPPTDTPIPPPTPVPLPPTPVPPTATPEPPPTATPAPVAVSPLATPTAAAVPASLPGKYQPSLEQGEANCAHIGVTGVVREGDEDDDEPISNVTVQVTGDEDGFRGPYYGTTDSDGNYGIVIGEFGKVPPRVEFRAEIYGPGVETDNRPEWQTTDDCHSENAIQIMRINWVRD
jgi:hypothetical protein